MNVYVDPCALSRERPIEDCILALLNSCGIAKILHRRAACSKFSWVVNASSYNFREFCAAIDSMTRGSGSNSRSWFSSLSKQQQRAVRILANELSAGFKDERRKRSANDAASRAAGLAWQISQEGTSTIQTYQNTEGGNLRQVALVPAQDHLGDDAVCRVLYCNHPNVTGNAANKGYVSQCHGGKHFLATNHSPSWVECTNIPNPSYGDEKVSKFSPGIQYGGSLYERLECATLLSAMKDGKYSFDDVNGISMNRHVYMHDEEIGASEGKMTRRIRLETHNRDAHIFLSL